MRNRFSSPPVTRCGCRSSSPPSLPAPATKTATTSPFSNGGPPAIGHLARAFSLPVVSLCAACAKKSAIHKCTGDALGFRAPSQGGQPRQGHSSAERCRPGIRIGSSSTRCARRWIRCSLELDDSIHSTLSASNERRSTESSLGIYLQLGMQCASHREKSRQCSGFRSLSQVLWQR